MPSRLAALLTAVVLALPGLAGCGPRVPRTDRAPAPALDLHQVLGGVAQGGAGGCYVALLADAHRDLAGCAALRVCGDVLLDVGQATRLHRPSATVDVDVSSCLTAYGAPPVEDLDEPAEREAWGRTLQATVAGTGGISQGTIGSGCGDLWAASVERALVEAVPSLLEALGGTGRASLTWTAPACAAPADTPIGDDAPLGELDVTAPEP